ncbi:MAG: thermonuclease family protein, partial [Phyllobacterium sp.]|uniref:thermonuclease family protein n=1 Tax=Phyllobacterium sp. TaxID=1871046 RepID=UPI0030F35FE7
SKAKCEKERKLALLAKYWLKALLKEQGLMVVYSGQTDKTQTKRKLIDIYDSDGNELGQKLLKEGFARPWLPRQKIDWCA